MNPYLGNRKNDSVWEKSQTASVQVTCWALGLVGNSRVCISVLYYFHIEYVGPLLFYV